MPVLETIFASSSKYCCTSYVCARIEEWEHTFVRKHIVIHHKEIIKPTIHEEADYFVPYFTALC